MFSNHGYIFPKNNSEIKLHAVMEPLFYNTNFQQVKNSIFYKRWTIYENTIFVFIDILNEDGSFMDFNTLNLTYGMWAQWTIGFSQRLVKKTNNILLKTCNPYNTNNFLYLLNATKSKKNLMKS